MTKPQKTPKKTDADYIRKVFDAQDKEKQRSFQNNIQARGYYGPVYSTVRFK
jgi:hypothetical protein